MSGGEKVEKKVGKKHIEKQKFQKRSKTKNMLEMRSITKKKTKKNTKQEHRMSHAKAENQQHHVRNIDKLSHLSLSAELLFLFPFVHACTLTCGKLVYVAAAKGFDRWPHPRTQLPGQHLISSSNRLRQHRNLSPFAKCTLHGNNATLNSKQKLSQKNMSRSRGVINSNRSKLVTRQECTYHFRASIRRKSTREESSELFSR